MTLIILSCLAATVALVILFHLAIGNPVLVHGQFVPRNGYDHRQHKRHKESLARLKRGHCEHRAILKEIRRNRSN